MNIVRATPLILAGWLLGAIADAATTQPLPESSFEDWTGLITEFELSDGSVLFEYTARTYSGITDGAMLAISFVPRFNCEPTVNVRLPQDLYFEPDRPTLEFTLGVQQRTYDGFVDTIDQSRVYSVAGSSAEVNDLRRLLDISNRTNVRIFSGARSARTKAREGFNLAFSLIGSRLSTLAARKSCLSHEPLAYQPDQ